MRITAIKLSLAAVAAIVIADLLNLNNTTAAGIIAILTALETRQASIERGAQYIAATIIAFIIATASFYVLGITVWSFGVYLLIFVPIATKFNLSSTIPPISVLVTHFLTAQSIDFEWHINGFLLMLIGVICANLVNLWMPDRRRVIRKKVEDVENVMRGILDGMGIAVQDVSYIESPAFREVKADIKKMNRLLNDLEEESLQDYENQLLEKSHYYIDYTSMRKDQLNLLETMCSTLSHLDLTTESNMLLGKMFMQTAEELDEENTGSSLLMRLAEMYRVYKSSDLPKTREEFESRALLYHLLINFESFLELKHNFYIEYRDVELNK
ncbi:aromatic acid exporter family protein [Aerococcaceae bacterium DSM 111022]|nr:aromatic acid exporter family protein [Aerococcaceae bacterium DSM 111022]